MLASANQRANISGQFWTILKVLLEADSFLSTYLPNGLGARIVNIQQIWFHYFPNLLKKWLIFPENNGTPKFAIAPKIMIPRKLWFVESLTLSEIKKLLDWQWWWRISRISVNLLIQWLYCSSTSFWSCWNCSSTQLTNTQSHFLLFYFYLLFFVYFLKILLNTSNALGGLRRSLNFRGIKLGSDWV